MGEEVAILLGFMRFRPFEESVWYNRTR